MTDTKFLNVNELADVLRTSENNCRIILRKGKIPGAFKLGGQWLIPASVVQTLAAGKAAEILPTQEKNSKAS